MAKKHIIWSSNINIKDWIGDKEEIIDENGRCWDECNKKYDCENCSRFYNYVTDLNDNYLYDEKQNLNKLLDNHIVALAELGLWDGKKNGYKILGSNLNCIFNISEDENTWYADGWNIRGEHGHHDGINYILYRKLKSSVSVNQFEEIMYKNNYKLTSHQISLYTESLLPYVAKVYGW